MSNQDMQLKVTLTADGRHLSGSLKTAAGEVREFGATTEQASSQAAKSLSKTRKGVESISTQLEQMRSHATRAVGVLAGMAGVNFTVQGFTQAIAEAKGLRGAMNEVATLLDDTSGLEQYRANVVQMGKAYGDTQKQANALYQIVSAGHGGMADSARILEQANKLALGGVTDVFVATDGLTTALNAYEYSAAEAEAVSDKFFIAMKGGKTSINEIASSIGQVAPLASNAGVALDQLLSASAALTTSGLSTSESMTQLKSIISGLLAPTAQARTHAAELGLEFDLAALKTKGLSGFLADLAEKTNGSAESVAQLFGSVEAQAAVLSLTGAQASKFSEILANMGDSANATNEAVDLLSQGAEFALDGIGRSLAALRLEAGESFLDALTPSLVYVNKNFDDLISTTAFLTKTTLALFAAYKLGPPLIKAVTLSTTAMSAATQAYTVRTLAATAATNAARLAMLALPHVAVAAGIATVVYAFTQYNNQQKETARLANEARASIAAYNAEQNSVEGLQARLKAEEEALAAAQATAAAHEAGTSQAAQSLEKLRSMIESGNFSGDTLAGLVQNYEKLQASIESATAKAEGSKQRIADLKEALAALGVQTDDTAAKLNSLGQTGEQSDAIEKLTAALVDQYTKLALGERAYLDYQLVQLSATAAQREQALAAYDSIEALKAQEAAQANYASTLSESASSSVKSLSDVEKQSQRVWSALASGKISTAQAAAAIDGLAAAGAGLVNEQQQWIDQMIAAMDPARALQEEITTLQEAFEDGLFGDLSEDKFNDYIDSLKKKLAELNGVKIQDPAVKMGSAMQTAAGGIKDVAGAMQGMYEQGSRGYQNMAVAMQAANVIAAVGAVLQQGMGDPYTAFARMAAMAAAVAGLGYSVGSIGGDAPDDAARRQAQQGTGTVLGDASAKSESISNAVEMTASATSELVGINRGMLRALESMQAGISGASVMIAQQMGRTSFDYGDGRTAIATPKSSVFDKAADFTNSSFMSSSILTFATGGLNKIMGGFFKGAAKILGGKSKVTDEGVQIVGATLAEMIEETTVKGYQTTRTRKSFAHSWKTHEATADLSDDVALQFNRVFASLADSVYQGATALGFAGDDVSDTINNFVIETQKISLKGLNAEEQQAEIEAVFSVMFDNLADSTVAFLPKFQQAGEALGETLVRVATNVQVAEEAVFRLGFAAENINPEQFASLSVYLIDAAGGLEQFIGAMSGFVDKFAPESHRLDLLSADMERSLAAVGLSVPSTRDEMWQLMQTLDATTEAGADQIATLLRLGDTADAYYKMLEQAGMRLQALLGADQSDALTGYLSQLADWSASELSRIEADYRERIALAEQQLRIGRELRQYVEQLRISELSPYDPGEKLQLATEQFAALLVKAEAGDMEAARLLQSSAQTYLQNADSYYGRSDPYLTIFEEVTRSLDRLGLDIIGGLDDNTAEKLNAQMLSEQQRIKDYTRDQLQWAVSQYDVLTSIEQLLELLPGSLADQLQGIINPTKPSQPGPPSRPSPFDHGGELAGGELMDAVRDWAAQDSTVTMDGNSLHVSSAPWFDGAVPLGEYSSLRAAVTALHQAYPQNVPKFATGGVFTNSIVSKPTYFDMGLMGEAGDEAIVPLHMGPQGLGIKNYAPAAPQVIVQTDPALLAEMAALRQEVAALRAERKSDASKAEIQRDRQIRSALKTPEVI